MASVYALRQWVSAGNEVYEEVRLSGGHSLHAPVRLSESASEAKRDARRRGEHVAPRPFVWLALGFRLLAFRLYL